jgi:hypothetical protein
LWMLRSWKCCSPDDPLACQSFKSRSEGVSNTMQAGFDRHHEVVFGSPETNPIQLEASPEILGSSSLFLLD